MTVREPKKRSNLRLKLGGAYFSAQRKLRQENDEAEGK